MDCTELTFSGHALRRMFERSLSVDMVRSAIEAGTVIADYPDDQPYPSQLLLGFVNSMPIHVVVAIDSTSQACYVVTAYPPDPALWTEDFKRRRKS